MSKIKTVFQCQACGYSSPKWLGKCPDCGAWNSFSEEKQSPKPLRSFGLSEPQPLSKIVGGRENRTLIGIQEFDRVLGGGLVNGSIILIGGDPGIGKSTLLLQAVAKITEQQSDTELRTVLYVSGEESPEQIKLRAERLSIDSDNIILLPETLVENIINAANDLKPSAVVIDSIQTIYTEELTSAPGSVGQIRESAAKLMFFAKRSDIPVFLIGHVTKEGAIAGPRVLEHIVDTVLYFEGDRGHPYRILRTMKNRFGSTNEIGVFEMTDEGLMEISNPSELFMSERPLNVSGSTVIATMEGTRPLLVEMQALVSPTTFGMPRRTSMGVDFNRVNLLIAVLEKKAGIHLGGMDVFINIVGGLKILEPAADMGIISSIVSSFREAPIDPKTILFGEVGLSGEVRAVAQGEARLKEAAKIGFKKAIIPKNNAGRLKGDLGLTIIGVKDVEEAIENIGN
ncbi:MAG: DNA repair protein RadA [Nitrospirae bacterium GWC2_46_6]|nr:MAG: DNA repair protein RadA [Nitrospirae bacterium GWA2_46_11]OGW22676.1 MAG: DNA repair protein RadA [Nitrospirae bacterium GWC2_46_6]OGW23527.1 MAG: DNA repair protein RadA [Nitrospirae bacterium GWB2_47_37]HAK87499.1 DNA repair protein RadA [Nitrospiraceae bacterium]HCZ11747.1 DNA repair protein RadA [Nitrospiraceae bacterium]